MLTPYSTTGATLSSQAIEFRRPEAENSPHAEHRQKNSNVRPIPEFGLHFCGTAQYFTQYQQHQAWHILKERREAKMALFDIKLLAPRAQRHQLPTEAEGVAASLTSNQHQTNRWISSWWSAFTRLYMRRLKPVPLRQTLVSSTAINRMREQRSVQRLFPLRLHYKL